MATPTYRPTASIPSPARSSVYSDTGEEPSFLSEPSNTSSSLEDHEDSLLHASTEQVQQRALQLLALDSVDLVDAASSPPLTTLDIPRPLPTAPQEQEQGQATALAFLRNCLQQAQDTDWQYTTPTVFGPPRILDPRAAEAQDVQEGGVNSHWTDRAFNLESYHHEEVEGEEEEAVEMERTTSALEFGDLALGEGETRFGGAGGAYGMAYMRDGEGDPAGAGARGMFD